MKVLIERTSKKWKGLQILSGAGLILGVVLALAGTFTGTQGGIYAGLCLGTGALALGVVAKVGAWWNHG
jgi:hypothetical protein